jgi:hypothetical protein
MNTNKITDIFRKNHTYPGTGLAILKGANQPPKKKSVPMADMNNMLAYSPKKKKAKNMEEYST